MEKPWMDTLMEALQPPPGKETPLKEPTPEPQNMPAPSPASFADVFGNQASSAKSPLEYVGSDYWKESWSDRVLAHAPAITVVLLFVVALGALSFFYRVQAGHLLVRFGEKISRESAQQAVVPVSKPSVPRPSDSIVQPPDSSLPPESPQPASTLNQPAASAGVAAGPSVDSPKNSDVSRNRDSKGSIPPAVRDSLRQPAAKAAENSNAGASVGVDDGQPEFRLALASLDEARTPGAKARAAGLLWAAVAKGSSDAEVELADVYARGDGVRKNCQQALILLAAARNAARESAELRVYGCR